MLEFLVPSDLIESTPDADTRLDASRLDLVFRMFRSFASAAS